jgi:hypothetical protein
LGISGHAYHRVPHTDIVLDLKIGKARDRGLKAAERKLSKIVQKREIAAIELYPHFADFAC